MAGDTIKKVIDLSVNSKEVQKSYKELQRAFDKFQDRLNKTLGNEAKQAAKALNDLKTRLRVEQDILRLEKDLTKETERQRENNRRSLEDTKARAAATVKNIESLSRLDFGGLIKNNIVRSIQEATKMRVRSIKDKTTKRVEGISSRYDSLIGIQQQGIRLNQEKIKYYGRDDVNNTRGVISNQAAIERRNNTIKALEAKKAAEVAKATSEGELAAGAAGASGAAVAGVVGIAISVAIDLLKKAVANIRQTFEDILGISFGIKKNFQDITSYIGSLLDKSSGMATYNTGTSLITNAEARTQQMKYGLSSAANWALSQTMGMIGMKSDEDMMYMNPSQAALFNRFMDRYESWYNQLESSGVLQTIQQFQLDFAMFKQELAMDFMQWFAENKTEIFNAIKMVAEVTKAILSVLMNLTKTLGGLFGWASSSGNTLSDTMSDYTNYSTVNSRNVTISVNQNNTATGVLSSQTALQEFFSQEMQKLSQELALEYA